MMRFTVGSLYTSSPLYKHWTPSELHVRWWNSFKNSLTSNHSDVGIWDAVSKDFCNFLILTFAPTSSHDWSAVWRSGVMFEFLCLALFFIIDTNIWAIFHVYNKCLSGETVWKCAQLYPFFNDYNPLPCFMTAGFSLCRLEQLHSLLLWQGWISQHSNKLFSSITWFKCKSHLTATASHYKCSTSETRHRFYCEASTRNIIVLQVTHFVHPNLSLDFIPRMLLKKENNYSHNLKRSTKVN